MFGLYRKVPSPVLVIAGTAPEPGADAELMAAYHGNVCITEALKMP